MAPTPEIAADKIRINEHDAARFDHEMRKMLQIRSTRRRFGPQLEP
jgi:hypothetical protein